MADTKSLYPNYGLVNAGTIAHAVFVGTGSNIAVAASTVLESKDNYGYGCTITDGGVGIFTVLFAAGPTRLFDVIITITGPTLLLVRKTAQSINADGLLTVSFVTETDAGVDTDPTADDTIRMTIFGSQSST